MFKIAGGVGEARGKKTFEEVIQTKYSNSHHTNQCHNLLFTQIQGDPKKVVVRRKRFISPEMQNKMNLNVHQSKVRVSSTTGDNFMHKIMS